jgi:MFS family permease
MLLSPNFITVVIAAICIGIFAAGGIWQLGLALMLELFPKKKGKYTSYYSLATSVSIMVTPYITGVISEQGITYVFLVCRSFKYHWPNGFICDCSSLQ